MDNTQRDYFPNLDLLRFLAALWVLITHYAHIGPAWQMVPYSVPEGAFLYFAKYGYMGVPVFFALSGFLISHVSENRHGVDFAVNRVVRLMPAFWVSMSLTAIVLAILGAPHFSGFTQWLSNLTLLPQIFGHEFVDGVYWTLVYEFIFYGWVVLLLLAGVYHRYLMVISLSWLTISALNMFILEFGPIERLFITDWSGAFVIGMVLYRVRKNGLTAHAVAALAISVLLLGTALHHADAQPFLIIDTGTMSQLTALAFALAIGGIVALSVLGPQIKSCGKQLALLGAISYPLYLVHQEIGYAVFRTVGADLATPIFVTGVAVAMIGLAFAVHIFAEKPLQRYLTRLAKPVVAALVPLVNRLLAPVRPDLRRERQLPAE
ncbi:MAG: acyltransferase [Pseudomonadota bacterium]